MLRSWASISGAIGFFLSALLNLVVSPPGWRWVLAAGGMASSRRCLTMRESCSLWAADSTSTSIRSRPSRAHEQQGRAASTADRAARAGVQQRDRIPLAAGGATHALWCPGSICVLAGLSRDIPAALSRGSGAKDVVAARSLSTFADMLAHRNISFWHEPARAGRAERVGSAQE
jgi:hypothetical protein